MAKLSHSAASLFYFRLGDMNSSSLLAVMMRYFASQKIQELGLLERYQWFIVTRTDQYYMCSHSIAPYKKRSRTAKDHVWIPMGEDYKGITDRHMVVHRQHVLQALNILPPLLQNPQQYRAFFQGRRHKNSEMFMKLRFDEEGLSVKRFDRSMFVAGAPGDSFSRKRAKTPFRDLGINVKYRHELFGSKMTCNSKLRKKAEDGE